MNTEGHLESIGHWQLCSRLCLTSCGRAGCCLDVVPRDQSNSCIVALHNRGFKMFKAEVGAGHATRLCSRKKDLKPLSESHTRYTKGLKNTPANMKSVERAIKPEFALRYPHLPQKEKPQVTEDTQASNTPVPLPDCAAWHNGFKFSGHFGLKGDLTKEVS